MTHPPNPPDPPDKATRLLALHSQGNRNATNELMAIVYDELRALAERHLERERVDHTLTPTALVHEAYLRLVDQTRIDWRGKSHFYAMAAKTLRRILVDHARGRKAAKRDPAGERVTLTGSVAEEPAKQLDLMQLDEALERLQRLSQRQADVVELRFFGGLSIKETAEALGVAEQTVKWSWRMARAWLLRELGDDPSRQPDGDAPS